jgi:hypothetical protein
LPPGCAKPRAKYRCCAAVGLDAGGTRPVEAAEPEEARGVEVVLRDVAMGFFRQGEP